MVNMDQPSQMEHGMGCLENCKCKLLTSVKRMNNSIHFLEIILLAVAGCAVTKQRSEVMTFAQPITEFYMALFIKNPEGSLNFKSYVAPLTNNAWMAIGMFTIMGSLTLFLTTQ